MTKRFTAICLVLISLVAAASASAQEAPGLDFSEEGVAVARAGGDKSLGIDQQQLEELRGREITGIEFNASVNLSVAELRKSLAFLEGSLLDERALQSTAKNLYRRDIFAHISVELRWDGAGIIVQFILTPRSLIGSVEFRGYYTLDERQLRRMVRVRHGESLSVDALREAKSRLLDGYRKAGHYQATVNVEVRQQTVAQWVTIIFDISENVRSEFRTAKFEGMLPPELESISDRLQRDASGLPASEENAQRIKRDLLLAMRREGYLQASVRDGEMRYDEALANVTLTFAGDVRQPISIVFTGNYEFSSAELLGPLRMDTRTVPFAPSALSTLAREIEKLYQQRGYYYATAAVTKLESEQDRQRYQIAISERTAFRIRQVRFVGNTNVADETLRDLVVTSAKGFWLWRRWVPGYLSKDEVVADAERLANWYVDKGYLEAEVSYALAVDHESQEFDVSFHTKEGPRKFITVVDLELSDILGEGDNAKRSARAAAGEVDSNLLLLRTNLNVGAPFDREALRAEQRRLFSAVTALGYPNAAVELQGDAQAGSVRYVVAPREKVQIGMIVLQGNALTHDYVLDRELTFNSGDVWSSELLETSKQNLSGLGFFRTVSLEPLDGALDEPVEDIAVRVDERETGRLGAGGSFTTEDGINLYGELGQRNVFGRGTRFLLGVDSYVKSGDRIFDAGRLRASFTRPRILNTTTEMTSEVFVQSLVKLIDQFSYDRFGAEVNLVTPWSENLRSTAGVIGYTERLYDVEEDVILGPDDTGRNYYTFVRSTLDFDYRDNRYTPRSGFRTVLDTRLAPSALGSQVDLFRASLNQTFLVPVRKRIVWANRFVVDSVTPFGGTDVVPISQRIFLGGRNSLRGFSRDSVGPRGFDLNVVGGDFSVNASTELRYDFTDSLTGLVFLDAGQAYLENQGTFSGDTLGGVADLRYSPGFGMHYQTPIGPIRAEYGIALDREDDERFGRINVSIGTGY